MVAVTLLQCISDMARLTPDDATISTAAVDMSKIISNDGIRLDVESKSFKNSFST